MKNKVNVVILGAGRPSVGRKPAALKKIDLKTRALDWQLKTFDVIADNIDFHFVGGYQVEKIMEKYHNLRINIVPNWENGSIIESFFSTTFNQDESYIVTYSDTIFYPETVFELGQSKYDLNIVVDSLWMNRYNGRTKQDIENAEIINLKRINKCIATENVEFTGLFHMKPRVVKFINEVKSTYNGKTIIELLYFLTGNNFSVGILDVTGKWAEFNSSTDIVHLLMGTKAETLARLKPVLKRSVIGDQLSILYSSWQDHYRSIIESISDRFPNSKVIVRSSSKLEDGWSSSNAGNYDSFGKISISDKLSLKASIDKVYESYGIGLEPESQVLIQKHINNTIISGVVFTCGLETGAPYYRINIDEMENCTDGVTAGIESKLRTFILYKDRYNPDYINNPLLVLIIEAVQEIEQYLNYHKLDIELAIDKNNTVHIFQIRPITVDHSGFDLDDKEIEREVFKGVNHYDNISFNNGNLKTKGAVLGNMPDWNPAEIIGSKPKPFSFSLYRTLITDETWALQRYEYGYKDLRYKPLIHSISGQPYVDVLSSINSFIPANITSELEQKLINAYSNILINNPQLHDKLEFDVVFTIWTPEFFENAKERFSNTNITDEDIYALERALKEITSDAILRLNSDIKTILELGNRRNAIAQKNITYIDKIFELINDCKLFGTLAFSHAARAGFVARLLLNSFVGQGVFSKERINKLLNSIETVTSQLARDKERYANGTLSGKDLINRYGHLRPGTYEITNAAYWENPSYYLFAHPKNSIQKPSKFSLTTKEEKRIESILSKLDSNITPEQIIQYIVHATQSREYTKFEFTKNLSLALDLCVAFGKENNIVRKDLSFLVFNDIVELKLGLLDTNDLLSRIEQRKNNYLIVRVVELPSLIVNRNNFFYFERPKSVPNYITSKKVEGEIVVIDSLAVDAFTIRNKIVVITQADPGYDWLFGYDISGLITKYGGANSHMAIRSAELSLPAAIGVGQDLYEQIAGWGRVELDCSGRVIREVI